MPFQAVRRKIQDTSAGAQSKRTISVDVSRRVVAFIAEHPGVFDGIEVVERDASLTRPGPENEKYLRTKAESMGHHDLGHLFE